MSLCIDSAWRREATSGNAPVGRAGRKEHGPLSWRVWLAVLALVGITPTWTAAQVPLAPRWAFETWTMENGLPVNTVSDVLQTRDGYLWLGTEEGIARFDGVRFETFDHTNGFPLGSSMAPALLEASNHDLWIATERGLVRHRGGAFKVLTKADGLPNRRVLALAEDAEGSLWVGTLSGLVRVRGEQIETPPGAAELGKDTIRALQADAAGRLWIGTRRGLFCLHRGVLREIRLQDDPGKRYVRALCLGGDDSLWIGTIGSGVFHLQGDTLTNLTAQQGLAGDAVFALLCDHTGAIWVGTNGGGISRLAEGRIENLTASQGLGSDIIQSLFEDREHSVWVGTGAGGLTRVRRARFASLTVAQGLSNPTVLPIIEDRTGRIWIGTAGGGVNVVENGQVRAPAMSGSLPHGIVTALCEDGSGGMWIGMAGGGLCRLEGTRLRCLSTAEGLPSNLVNAVVRDRAGETWVGTTGGGLARLAGSRFETVAGREELGDTSVLSLHPAPDGTLWMGTLVGGLARWQDGHVTRVVPEFEPLQFPVFAFFDDPDGSLWVGTGGGGLVRVKNGIPSVVTRRHGLFNNLVGRMLADDAGNLWMSCNKGLFRAPLDELRAVADGRASHVTCVVYGRADGMPSAECNTGVAPAGTRMHDGRLWFPTSRGVAIVDPDDLADNPLPPPVVIETVLLDGDAAPREVRLGVPAGTRALEIRYTGLSLASPSACRFAYRLEGFDTSWVEAGNRRAAYYSSLGPGHYTFRVKGCNNDGVWNETGASLDLMVGAYPYQTAWFWLVAWLLAVAAGVIGHRIYIRRSRARERAALALAEERRRAAEELAEERGMSAEALARFRAVFDHAAVGIARLDSRGRILEANARLGTIVATGGADLEGLTLAEAVDPEDRPALVGAIDELVGGRRGSFASQLRFSKADRTVTWVNLSLSLLRDQGGARLTLVAVMEDTSAQRHLEEQLRQSQKMEAVGRLAGGVAHDFNNVLQGMLSLVQVLRMGRGTPERRDSMLKEIEDQVKRGAGLARQLLLFARRDIMRRDRLDLNAEVSQSASLLRRLLRENVRLDVKPVAEPVWANVDRGQLGQVLTNLVVNAADAMPHGGEIVVRTGRGHGEVWLEVADSGGGIPAEVRPHIFEPFFTTKEVGRGTGLGLSVTHGIVSAHDGRIEVDSPLGRGSVFRVVLPDAGNEPGPGAAPAVAGHDVPSGRGERVLVVEDDEGPRQGLVELLTRLTYEVVAVSNGEAALKLAQEPPFRVLLTDMVLPGQPGTEVARQLRARWPELGVIFMSGYAADEETRRQLGDDAVRFLQKPFDMASLAREVQAALGAPPGPPVVSQV